MTSGVNITKLFLPVTDAKKLENLSLVGFHVGLQFPSKARSLDAQSNLAHFKEI
jgi:hypothetical protein